MEFRYVAISEHGKRMTGRLNAPDKQTLARLLKQNNVQLVSCKVATVLYFQHKVKLSNQGIIELSRQMAILLFAGLRVTEAFRIFLSEQEDKQLGSCVSQLLTAVEQGTSVAVAMEQSDYLFDKQYLGSILVGEESGQLAAAFQQNFQYLSTKQVLSQKIKQACTYPVIVLLTALMVITLLLIKVIPGFQTLFANFDQALPLSTQFVITLSDALQAHWLELLLSLVASMLLIRVGLSCARVRYYFDQYKLQLPVLGPLFNYYFFSWFSLSCHHLLVAGVPLHKSIGQLALSTKNQFLARRLTSIEQQLKVGSSFHHACRLTQVFPALLIQLLQVGESSGTLDKQLLNLSEVYQSKLKNHIDQVVKLVEPAIMLITGILIGGLVLVMYLPIFQMSAFM